MTTLYAGAVPDAAKILGTQSNIQLPETSSQTLTNGRYANWSLTFLGGMAILGVIGAVALTVLALYEALPMNALIGLGGLLCLHYFVLLEEVFNIKEMSEFLRSDYQELKLQSLSDLIKLNSEIVARNTFEQELKELKTKYSFYAHLNDDDDDGMRADGSGFQTPIQQQRRESNSSSVDTTLASTPKMATPVGSPQSDVNLIQSQYFASKDSK